MASGGPPLQSSETDSSSAALTWEGDKMFHIYIHDYCNKRGYTKTANQLVLEADIPQDSQPPINAKQGLLFEWWSVFWTLFTAKNNGQGPEEAILYTQHQASQAAIRQQNRNQPPQQQRMNNGGLQRPPGAMPPNGVGPTSMPGGQVGMPNGVQGHMGFPMSNPSGHPPNGAPGAPGGPQQQQHIQHMMSGQRPMGVGPQGPQNPAGTVQMGPGQHVAQMGRGMLPPNGPHNMGNPMGSTAQAPSPGFNQIGRPSSRPSTPSQGMITNPSPSMGNRQVPGAMGGMQMQDISVELMRIPAPVLANLKAEAGLGDKDLNMFTQEEKQRIIQLSRQRRPNQKPPSQQGPSVAGPSSTPSMQSANIRNPPQGRAAKRNSTSPGDEDSANRTEGSPPERKRPRPSPNGGEHPLPPGPPQQQQPPMVPMAPFNHQGLTGAQNMQMRMGNPPMNFNHQQGVHMNMGQNMPQMGPGASSPGMMANPPPTMIGASNNPAITPQMQIYRQTMHNLHKNHIPPGALGSLLPGNAGSPQSNPQQQGFGPGSMNSGGPSNKPMGNMMPPPPSPGMKQAQQPKDGHPDGSNRPPENSPQTHPMGQPGAQNQGNSQQQPQQQQSGQHSGPGTAPPTPVSNPGSGITPESSSSNLLNNNQQQQQPNGVVGSSDPNATIFSPDFIRSMMVDDFDTTGFLRNEAGDLNFERDFGQWFNPDEMPLDLK